MSADPRYMVHPAIVEAIRRRRSITLTLSVIMIGLYFAFMFTFGFNKPLLSTMITPELSIALISAPILIMSSVLLSLVYVLWANRVFDVTLRDNR